MTRVRQPLRAFFFNRLTCPIKILPLIPMISFRSFPALRARYRRARPNSHRELLRGSAVRALCCFKQRGMAQSFIHDHAPRGRERRSEISMSESAIVDPARTMAGGNSENERVTDLSRPAGNGDFDGEVMLFV